MTAFVYKGRDVRGMMIEGLVDAPDSNAAADTLVSRGITPVAISEEKSRDGFMLDTSSWFKPKVTEEDLMFFSRQMYTLMKAGVPILQALGGLRESTHNVSFADVLARIRESLDSGRELSIALSDSGVFSPFYISMIKVGEMTGRLDIIFLRLYEHLEFEKDMRAKIKAAIRYPSFVILAMAVALIILNIFVIPAFAQVFAAYKAPLPLMTLILLGFSKFTVNYWYLVFGGIGGVVYLSMRYVNTAAGRLAWDRHKLRLPIIGPIINKATLARFARSFAMSLASGLPVTQAFSVVGQVVDNTYIADKLEQMRTGVERGESIIRSASNSGIFTHIVLQMIAVGEETGDVDGLLLEVADMYDREVKYEVDNLSARIEPILIVFMAGLVLMLALGIFLPMWDLGSTMTHKK